MQTVANESTSESTLSENASGKRRYAAVGTGGRIPMFIDPLVRDYPEVAELVALCDASATRSRYHQQRLMKEYGYHEVPTYLATDFERMIEETRPDVVIVCTKDSTHHEYIIKALDLGCDVVTEKPMTTDSPHCRAIFEAVERTGKKVRVGFNYRWTPGATRVRQLIADGVIGNVKHVTMEYMLNTSHGADYFRRWHSEKESSGGLLVHKSTHHFDLVNWWLDGVPQEVFCYGSLQFYGRENALARGEEARTRYDRYTGSEASDDPFYLDLEEESMKALYKDAEEETGYIRDRNVFREGIDIEDTMSVLVKYRTGSVLNYSLVAYCPEEGFRATFNGDKGRIEYTEMHTTHIMRGQSDLELGEEQSEGEGTQMHLRVLPLFKEGYIEEIPAATGSHGGGDALLQEQIFSLNPPQEIYGRGAGHEQGAASILIGIAANNSINSGLPVKINDLCPVRPEAKKLSELI